MSGTSCHCSSKFIACGAFASMTASASRRATARSIVSAATAEPSVPSIWIWIMIVALHPRRPRGRHLRERAALELERREHLVLDVDVVRLPGLVDAPRDLRHLAARHRLDRSDQAGQQVAPVRIHIEHQPAAVLLR
jgi:hypothetical protein